MSVFQAFILGIVQGLTEFLPISSSGHLVVLPLLFGWQEQPLVFDTTLHLGTAAALLIYFWRDLIKIKFSFINDVLRHRFNISAFSEPGYLGVLILVGIIPAGLLGFLFDDVFETYFRGIITVAVFMTLGSFLMLAAEKLKKQSEEKLTVRKSLFIGLLQSLALFPGVSRSGSTISAGMLAGLSRETAARFSFLLSVPIVVLAGLYKLATSFGELSEISVLAMSAGFIASLISGLVAIELLLRFVKNNSLVVFVIYRLVLAGFLIIVAL